MRRWPWNSLLLDLLLEPLPPFSCNHGEEDLNNWVNLQHVNTQSLWVWRLTLMLIYYEAYLFSANWWHFTQIWCHRWNQHKQGQNQAQTLLNYFHLFKKLLNYTFQFLKDWQSCLFVLPFIISLSVHCTILPFLQSLSLPPTSPFPCLYNELNNNSRWHRFFRL